MRFFNLSAFITALVCLGAAFGGCDKSQQNQPGEANNQGVQDTKATKTTEGSLSARAPGAPGTSGAAQVPPATQQPATKELTQTPAERLGVLPEGLGIPVGGTLPAVQLTDIDGKPASLVALADKHKRLLVIFYRGGWCPYCNSQVRQLAKEFPKLQARGVTPVLISVDKPDEAAKTSAAWQIPFPVLSDSDLVAHKAFRVLNPLNDEQLQQFAGFGPILEQYSGRDHHTIAVPSIFLFGPDKTVLWAHADPAYKVRPTMEQLLTALDSLGFAIQ
jgi:peroxiredoxin